MRALWKGLAVVSMPGSNLSEGRIELRPKVSGAGPLRVEDILLNYEFPEKREQHLIPIFSQLTGDYQKGSNVRA